MFYFLFVSEEEDFFGRINHISFRYLPNPVRTKRFNSHVSPYARVYEGVNLPPQLAKSPGKEDTGPFNSPFYNSVAFVLKGFSKV